MSGMDFDDNQEIIEEFLVEGRESLAEIESVLMEMEQHGSGDGADSEQLNKVFRTFHSLKGTAGFLGFDHIVEVTHKAESLLDLVRKGERVLDKGRVTLLCEALDFSNAAIDCVEETSTDEAMAGQSRLLAGKLKEALDDDPGAPAAASMPSEPPAHASAAAAPTDPPSQAEPSQLVDLHQADWGEVRTIDLGDPALAELVKGVAQLEECLTRLTGPGGASARQEAIAMLSSMQAASLTAGVETVSPLLASAQSLLLDLGDDAALWGRARPALEGAVQQIRAGVLAALSDDAPSPPVAPSSWTEDGVYTRAESVQAMPTPPPKAADPAPKAMPAPPPKAADPAPKAAEPPPVKPSTESASKGSGKEPVRAQGQSSIRVDVHKLDALMNLVGELIIAERMVTHNDDISGLELENFGKAALQLNRITRSLQDVAMSARMLPVRGVFRKMLRLVRDLSIKQGKDIRLDLEGEETDVDKSVIEAIADPLVHLVRNACDHGVETADKRVAAGKPAQGVIKLSARHQGGEVWISIEDDGNGLDRQRILDKAISRGIVKGEPSRLKDSEVFMLIFEPGFSTAAAVTDISGRGVGMDVVKRNIERLRGRVDVTSTPGQGTRFTLRIPLTLAIVEGMLVRVGDLLCTIPLLNIRESVSGYGERITTLPDGRPMVQFRGEFIPIVSLREMYGLDRADQGTGILVIVEEGENRIGLAVDELIGQRQTVIKALPSYLGRPKGLSGCSILSNGDISLILDVNTLMNAATAA